MDIPEAIKTLLVYLAQAEDNEEADQKFYEQYGLSYEDVSKILDDVSSDYERRFK